MRQWPWTLVFKWAEYKAPKRAIVCPGDERCEHGAIRPIAPRRNTHLRPWTSMPYHPRSLRSQTPWYHCPLRSARLMKFSPGPENRLFQGVFRITSANHRNVFKLCREDLKWYLILEGLHEPHGFKTAIYYSSSSTLWPWNLSCHF